MNEFPYQIIQIIQIIHTLFCWRLLTMIVQICCITWELLDEFCAFLITMQQTEKYPWSWCLLKIFHCWQIRIRLYVDVLSSIGKSQHAIFHSIPIFLLYFELIRVFLIMKVALPLTKSHSAMLLSLWNYSLMNHDTIILTNIRKREWHLHAICRLFKLNTCFVRILHLSSFSILSSWNGNLFCRHSEIWWLA